LLGLLGLILTARAGGQEASRPARPAPLSRYFPSRGLVAYAEFDGVDAHRAAWEKTAAYRLLTETTTGAMLEQAAARLLDLALEQDQAVAVGGRDLVALGEHLLRNGIAVGFNRAAGAGPPRSLAIVFRGAAGGKARSIIDRFLRAGVSPRTPVKAVDKPGGRRVSVLGNPARGGKAWWAEGDDLVVCLVAAGGVDAIIAALDGLEPNATDHPTRAALARGAEEPGFDPVGLAFCDRTAFPPPSREAVALGLDKVKRLDYRWGFRGPAIEAIVGLESPAPRTGSLSLIDQPTFDARHLPPLPGGLDGFTILSLDPVRLYDQLVASQKVMVPLAPGTTDRIPDAINQAVGLKLREEFLAFLGPRIVCYTVPTRVNAATNPLAGFAQGMVFVPRASIAIEVKDQPAVARALDTLAPRVNRAMRSLADAIGGGEVGEFKRLKGDENGRVLSVPAALLPMAAGLRPTLLLGRKELVLATSPATGRRALDFSERASAGGLPAGDPLGDVLKQLPDRLIFLGVDDVRQSMAPELLISLPNAMEYVIIRKMRGLSLLEPLAGGPAGPNPGGEGARHAARKLAMDPELIPEPESLRPFLFPSVYAMAVDDRGIRLISREAFPTFNPATLAPVALAMIAPELRLSAEQARSTENLKQIGLALFNYHSANNHFPADILAKDGKPLLSWRLRLLPQLGHQALYNEFHLDEPWDSPHNKALLDRMPEVFDSFGVPVDLGRTYFRGFSGEHAFFDPKVPAGVEMASFTDGTSNTIALVEAREAVPWTRPDSDIPFGGDPTKLEDIQALRGELGGHKAGGFHALMVDGAVRFIKDSVNPVVLRAIITRDGGEVVASDSY
jgi:hypothetical protein